jgi:hypothetical protein
MLLDYKDGNQLDGMNTTESRQDGNGLGESWKQMVKNVSREPTLLVGSEGSYPHSIPSIVSFLIYCNHKKNV